VNEEDQETDISATERFLWVLVLITPMTLLGGWATKLMWGWFVVPLGVPAVSVFHAAGIHLMLRTVLITVSPTTSKNHPLYDAFVSAGTLLVLLGVCALLGLLV